MSRRRITIGKEGPGHVSAKMPRDLVNYVELRAVQAGISKPAALRLIIAERKHLGEAAKVGRL